MRAFVVHRALNKGHLAACERNGGETFSGDLPKHAEVPSFLHLQLFYTTSWSPSCLQHNFRPFGSCITSLHYHNYRCCQSWTAPNGCVSRLLTCPSRTMLFKALLKA